MKKIFRLGVFIFIFFLFIFLPQLSAVSELLPPNLEPTISMDFKDADLKDILKLFSIQSGLNFIASEAVQDRRITLYLDRVAIREAMDKIFKANNLSYELDEEAGIFMVKDWGKPQIETITKVFYLRYATVSTSSFKEGMSKQVAVTAAAGIATEGTATGGTATGGTTGKWAVEDDTGITKAVKKILSEYGSVIEDFRTNSLIVTDIPSRMPIIAQVIASLDVSVPQVMLEVEILDVSKNTVDNLGFEFADNPFTLILPGGFVRRGAKFYIGAASDRNQEGGVTLGKTYAHLLDFLSTQTDTKYLARPRILTLNNETAEISITKDEVVGYDETRENDEGVETVTRVYIRSTDLKLTPEGTGVFLRVTPQINPDTDEITLVINPKSSITSPSELSATQSDAEVRSTKSIIKLRDGETVIMGGLIHTDKTVIVKKIPILGDIPLIRMLFRHKDQTRDIERELLVFITPHILKDTNTRLAQTKKVVPFLEREQNTISRIDRQAVINSSLNRFEKRKK